MQAGQEDDEAGKLDFDGWLGWDENYALDMTDADDPDAQKRAHYRLGLIEWTRGQLDISLSHFSRVVKLDPSFYRHQVNLRIAEIHYKLDDMEEALRTLRGLQNELPQKDKYMLHLLRGKCHDKERKFRQAAIEYAQALQLAV